MVLMVLSLTAALAIFRQVEREPRAQQIAQLVVSVINLARAAVLSAALARWRPTPRPAAAEIAPNASQAAPHLDDDAIRSTLANIPDLDSRFGLASVQGRMSSYTRCLLYTSPSPRDRTRSRMPSSA